MQACRHRCSGMATRRAWFCSRAHPFAGTTVKDVLAAFALLLIFEGLFWAWGARGKEVPGGIPGFTTKALRRGGFVVASVGALGAYALLAS